MKRSGTGSDPLGNNIEGEQQDRQRSSSIRGGGMSFFG
jgi:hypothetical protein